MLAFFLVGFSFVRCYGMCCLQMPKASSQDVKIKIRLPRPIINHEEPAHGTTGACEEEQPGSSYGEAMEPPEDHHCTTDCKHDSCSEATNGCKATSSSSCSDSSSLKSGFVSCSEGDKDIVARLEDYLNKLWNEVAQQKNPSYVPKTIEPPGPRCQRCKD